MSANAGRTALFPIGPTDPYAFEAGSQQRTEIAKALTEIRDADWQFASTVDGQELRTGNVQNVSRRTTTATCWAKSTSVAPSRPRPPSTLR